MKFILTQTLLLALLSTSLLAQEKKEFGRKIAEFKVDQLDLISIDTQDHLFISNSSGDIYQFSPEGKELNLFSPPNQGRLNQLEAAWSVNIFSFSSDLQEYRILDRFLNPLAKGNFTASNILLAKAATLGNNNVVWVWDESDLSLKSIDYLRNIQIQSQPLSLVLRETSLNVSEIREYKNRLFMTIPDSGIFIFDNQGNLIKKINLQDREHLAFYKDFLVWVQGDTLMGLSLSTQSQFEICASPERGLEQVKVGQEYIAFTKSNTVFTYQIPPWLKEMK